MTQIEYFIRYCRGGTWVNTLSTWPTAEAAARFIPRLVELVPGVREPVVMRRIVLTQPAHLPALIPDEFQTTNL